MATIRITLGTWLEGLADAAADEFAGRFTAEQRAAVVATENPMVLAGYLMGSSDAYRTVQSELNRAQMADRMTVSPTEIDEPPLKRTDRTHGTVEEPEPLTVAGLRAFLAAHPDLDGELPVVVGGVEFDDPTQWFSGLADAIWFDTEGMFGGPALSRSGRDGSRRRTQEPVTVVPGMMEDRLLTTDPSP